MISRLADLYDRFFQKLTLALFYYVPVGLAYLQPFYRKADIRVEHPGSVSFETERYAVYVLWQPGGTVPWYVLNTLESLRDHQVNTIVVSNHELTSAQLATLQGLAARVLVRGNKGFDFGAYKDAILTLAEGEKPITRVLIFNDSVYVFKRGLSQLIEELLSDRYDVVAAYENWELHYHFQSFCIGISGRVFAHPRMLAFWQSYRPISIRRWCINSGEVRLSHTLRKITTNFRIVFGINNLLDCLTSEADLATILQYREFVPRPIRKGFPEDDLLSVSEEADAKERTVILRRLKERLSDLLMLRAQSHTGAFFFPKFLSSPFLKRDIVYRELFTVYEVERMLLELGLTEELPSITDEIRRRGTAAHLRGVAKRRYRLGLI